MVSSPLPGQGAMSSVRRPVFGIEFGGTGLASAVTGGLDAGLGDGDPWKRGLVALAVEAGLAPSADAADVCVRADDQTSTVAVGDDGSISLGYEDDSTDLVFTGQVASVSYGVQGGKRAASANGSAALSRLRVNQSYEQQKAGDIVRDLARRAEVNAGTVEAGVSLPFYVVDDRRSAYQHIATLARKSGYLAYFTPENKLNFVPFTAGRPVQTFAYGEDIISLGTTEAVPVVETVTTVGEGAAGSQGQEAWSWLVKDPSSVTGNARVGGAERQVQDASLRSADAAQSAADGIANAAGRMGLTGELLVPGSPAVVVGSAVEIKDAPQDALNGLFLVRRVRHRFSKREGFTSLICFSETGEGGVPGLGGLL